MSSPTVSPATRALAVQAPRPPQASGLTAEEIRVIVRDLLG